MCLHVNRFQGGALTRAAKMPKGLKVGFSVVRSVCWLLFRAQPRFANPISHPPTHPRASTLCDSILHIFCIRFLESRWGKMRFEGRKLAWQNEVSKQGAKLVNLKFQNCHEIQFLSLFQYGHRVRVRLNGCWLAASTLLGDFAHLYQPTHSP